MTGLGLTSDSKRSSCTDGIAQKRKNIGVEDLPSDPCSPWIAVNSLVRTHAKRHPGLLKPAAPLYQVGVSCRRQGRLRPLRH
jgi:hypothetical protein